jgi:carbamoyl-phosphate synthase large subunit
MPKRTDLRRIVIIGSGPIVIGQAGEFDYSGAQACKALLEEGFEVILVNNNPATIMTDPEFSTRVYLEPLVPETLEQIIAKEQPDALLPTVGGQTAINLAVTLAEEGVLERYGVELIGAKLPALKLAEDRQAFQRAMREAGVPTLQGCLVGSLEEAEKALEKLGLPAVVRPSFTLGGEGGGVAHTFEEFQEIVERGLSESPVHTVLIEESALGWKEFELEVMRDLRDNVVIICSIENFDPMGVHTGDSITVAPAQTLTDREYQLMRDYAIRVIRAVGVETGGSNIQFAVHPETGRMVVIEMNPRVSRSSALASKATGFPIAKIAAKLAVGYTLDELPNDITKTTKASFEPTIDYCVVKIPRWNFEKFPDVPQRLGTEMKSVGEVMALGRTFKEALQKAVRSLEIGATGLVDPWQGQRPLFEEGLAEELREPTPDRLFKLYGALRAGVPVEKVARWTGIDPWFLAQLQQIAQLEGKLRQHTLGSVPQVLFWKAKRYGFSDEQLAAFWGTTAQEVRERRKALGIVPAYKTVDTCAAEFEAQTPYFYSAYEPYSESERRLRRKVVILGGGPYRIGQGIEFDYCCCHAAFALRELGYETILINCNPETVSTDYDTSDKLYFEPVTLEDVLNVLELERPDGVIVQYGGQTPLKLARALEKAGAPIWGTPPAKIHLAEDREQFDRILEELGIPRPQGMSVRSLGEAKEAAWALGYPVLVRPSYVLGGRAMEIAYDEEDLMRYMHEAVRISPEHPVLIDKFLEGAIEVDVDAVADGQDCVIAGIMEHIEEAGVHSGDSCCVLPPHSLSEGVLEKIRRYTRWLAARLGVVGLINVQYAVLNEDVYVLEVNPRASRTVPFVSKATGVPWAKVGAWVMAGSKLQELSVPDEPRPLQQGFAVKAPAFPFERLKADPVLGPEMKSTGELMGIGSTVGEAFAKTQLNLKTRLPAEGRAFLSVHDRDKPEIAPIARRLYELGFSLYATGGTARVLQSAGLSVEIVPKLGEGHPNVQDLLRSGRVQLVINTPQGKGPHRDDAYIRLTAMRRGIPYVTTLEGARAALEAIEALRRGRLSVRALPVTSVAPIVQS